jgi:class 3 adenylate cyclase
LDGLRTTLAAIGTVIRVGVHAGEVELLADGDVAGVAVHAAARIAAAAGPGEILVSRTVSDLVAGSDIRFGESRLVMLKGLPEPWSLSPLRAGPSGR